MASRRKNAIVSSSQPTQKRLGFYLLPSLRLAFHPICYENNPKSINEYTLFFIFHVLHTGKSVLTINKTDPIQHPCWIFLVNAERNVEGMAYFLNTFVLLIKFINFVRAWIFLSRERLFLTRFCHNIS